MNRNKVCTTPVYTLLNYSSNLYLLIEQIFEVLLCARHVLSNMEHEKMSKIKTCSQGAYLEQ